MSALVESLAVSQSKECMVTEPLCMASHLMYSEECSALSGAYPVLFSLISYHLSVNDKDCTAVLAFLKQVSDDPQCRYNMIETDKLCNSPPIVCPFLDPCYLSLPFLMEAQHAVVREHIL